jgi:hypothetical protein
VTGSNGPEAARRGGPSPRRRAAVALLLAAAVATAPAVGFASIAVRDTSEEIEAGRMRLAQLAATQADRVVTEAFYEIELMAQSLAPVQGGRPLATQAAGLEAIHSRSASFHSGVVLLDDEGARLAAVPPGAFGGAQADEALETATKSQDRAVSQPWLDDESLHALAALSVPLYASDGTRAATIVGILDLAEPLIADLIVPAARLGPSGHADLVDDRGLVLASTDPIHVLTAGDHPDFYKQIAGTRVSRVQRVAHLSVSEGSDHSEFHVMAYTPLLNAPWGIAIGSDAEATMETVHRLQGQLLALGAASALTLLLGIGIALRWIPRRAGTAA